VQKRLVVLLCCLAPAVGQTQNCPISISHPGVIELRHPTLVFENASLLSSEQQSEISKTSPNAEQATEKVRVAYQDAGYCKVRAEGKTKPVEDDSSKDQEIVINVVDPGLQYRLGELAFSPRPRIFGISTAQCIRYRAGRHLQPRNHPAGT
jgi:hypothetical protein